MVCIIPDFEVNCVQLVSKPLVFIANYCRIKDSRLDANEGHIGWTERPLRQKLYRLREGRVSMMCSMRALSETNLSSDKFVQKRRSFGSRLQKSVDLKGDDRSREQTYSSGVFMESGQNACTVEESDHCYSCGHINTIDIIPVNQRIERLIPYWLLSSLSALKSVQSPDLWRQRH